MRRAGPMTVERAAVAGFGVVVSALLSVLVWTGTRMVSGFDRLNEEVVSHGLTLGRFDERLGHVEKNVETILGRRE